MDGVDEEFEKLLGEIPQAMETSAQLEVLDTIAEHTLSQLEGMHVPRTQSTETFQGLLQAFQPLSDLGGGSEEHMYFPLSAGNAGRREDGVNRSMNMEEKGRNNLDCSRNANSSGALDGYPLQQEEDLHKFVSNMSNSTTFQTPEDSSLTNAFATLELSEGAFVQDKSKQAEKMGHAELLGLDRPDLIVEPAALHDHADAALCNTNVRSTNFDDEVRLNWLADKGFVNSMPSMLSSAKVASNQPALHPLRQDLKSFACNTNSKPVFHPSAESLVMSVPVSHMYRQACVIARDVQPGNTLHSYCDGSTDFTNMKGLAADSDLPFRPQVFGSHSFNTQLGKFEGSVVCSGQVDGMTNFDSTGNGMVSYAQAHKVQLLQQLREEERKRRTEQIMMHRQPAGCPQNCVGNNFLSSLYIDSGHGYGFPQVGDAFNLDLQHHLRRQFACPHADNFCTLCRNGVCCMSKDCPQLDSKPRVSPRNKDFLVSPAHFEKVLRKSTSLTLHDEKPPVKILSRKSSRVAAPSSCPLMGCYPVNSRSCIHNESQKCFHPPAAFWNSPTELDSFTTSLLDPHKSSTDAMHTGFMYSSLTDIEGRIFSVAKDQHGCRYLQRKFDEGAIEDVQKIFSEIIDHAVELMVDPFGNYLIQKLLEVCTDDQRIELLKSITRNGELIKVSLNTHGTRAVQKLVETLNSNEQVSITTASLRPGVVTLIKDLNGNHVIQRCLQHLSKDDNEFIFEAAAYNCVEIATHRHGCCVLQRCIDHSTGASRQRLIHEIALNSLQLAQDSFGNYVVQYVLDLGLSWANEEVMDRLVDNYASLSMQKFSSNVVEKCLQLSGEEGRVHIVRELIDSSHLLQLLQDPYANYVIQSALMVSKGTLHTSVVEAIRPHIPSLRSSPYGKRILSRRSFKKF